MAAFVKKELKYPEAARDAKVEGTVVLRVSIDYRGKVVATRVKKGLGHGCDEEAQRVISLLQFDVPQSRKKKVRIHQDLNVHFKLSKAKKTSLQGKVVKPKAGIDSGLQIMYSTSSTAGKKPTVKVKKDESDGYGYTIKW